VELPPEREGTGTLTLEVVEDPWGPSSGEESPEDLLRACADMRDFRAWERFLSRFNPIIVATVVRTSRRYGFDGAGLSDDLVQEVYLKFSAHEAKVLRQFKPRQYPGAVFRYVMVIAANVVHDHFKSKGGKYPDQSPLSDDVAGPDETEWRLLLREIDDLLRRPPVSERDRHIFWFYYRHGMSAKEIAALSSLKLTTEGVESVLVRLNKLIRSAFEGGERQSRG
ncbi:MAG: sigma-70 family RNA polymerase sigma factor, partial [Bryobacteraceae bacterium]